MRGALTRLFIGKCDTHDNGAVGQFERVVLVMCAQSLSSEDIELVSDTEASDLVYHAWSGATRTPTGRSSEERQQMLTAPIRCAFFLRGGKYAEEEMKLCTEKKIPVVCVYSNGKRLCGWL